jgi:hypothetical protein
MISDFREISLKSGGLRAGLYRGFLPSFVIYTLFTTEIEFEPKISSFNKLSGAWLLLRLVSLNITSVIQNRLEKLEDSRK